MIRKLLLLSLLLGLVLSSGCMAASKDGGWFRQETLSAEHAPAAQATGPDAAKIPVADKSPAGPTEPVLLSILDTRKIVYTGEFDVLARDVRRAVVQAKALADRLGGYVGRMTEREVVLRVPADKFHAAVAALEELGVLARQEIIAHDVTEECTDLEVRLRNAKAMLDRLRATLEKAQNVKDALEVEREMRRVSAEVDTLENQLNRLSNQIGFATLTVRFAPLPDSFAAGPLTVRLPFWWLRGLGLDCLMNLDS